MEQTYQLINEALAKLSPNGDRVYISSYSADMNMFKPFMSYLGLTSGKVNSIWAVGNSGSAKPHLHIDMEKSWDNQVSFESLINESRATKYCVHRPMDEQAYIGALKMLEAYLLLVEQIKSRRNANPKVDEVFFKKVADYASNFLNNKYGHLRKNGYSVELSYGKAQNQSYDHYALVIHDGQPRGYMSQLAHLSIWQDEEGGIYIKGMNDGDATEIVNVDDLSVINNTIAFYR